MAVKGSTVNCLPVLISTFHPISVGHLSKLELTFFLITKMLPSCFLLRKVPFEKSPLESPLWKVPYSIGYPNIVTLCIFVTESSVYVNRWWIYADVTGVWWPCVYYSIRVCVQLLSWFLKQLHNRMSPHALPYQRVLLKPVSNSTEYFNYVHLRHFCGPSIGSLSAHFIPIHCKGAY